MKDSHIPYIHIIHTVCISTMSIKNIDNQPMLNVWSILSRPPYEADEKAILTKMVEDYQMPVTHLNNFLDMMRGGPSVFLEQNLLRFPQTKTVANVYGTAMHKVLEYAHTHLKREGVIPSLEQSFKILEKQIISGRLNQTDTTIQIDRGKKALTLYYKLRLDRIDAENKIEVDFKHQGVLLGDTRITGKIDKMVFKGNQISVYDFKTGKPKFSWKGIDSYSYLQLHMYKRQLIFYKLLVENSRQYKNYEVNHGSLEFLEPYKNDLVDLELFLDKKETERVSDLAKIVYQKIVNLDFPDTAKYSRDLDGSIAFEDDLLSGAV